MFAGLSQVPSVGLKRGYSSLYSAHNLPSYVLQVPPTKVTTTPSGFRVASEDGFGQTGTVGIWIDAGSAFENARNNGTAHFLEHMAFKGTAKRTKRHIEEEVEQLGGHFNAYTTRQFTTYYSQCFKQDIPHMVELLSDVLQNSQLDEGYVENERSVILQEKDDVEKDITEIMHDYIHTIAFEGTPLSLTILGQVENINSISRQDLIDYISTNYTAPRMVLVGAGAVNHDQLIELAEKHFSNIPNVLNINPDDTLPTTWKGGQILDFTTAPHKEDTTIGVGFEGVSWADPNYYVFVILQNLLGSWEDTMGNTANLFGFGKAVAEHGLATKFDTFNTSYKQAGVFGVSAKAAPHNLHNLVEAIMATFPNIIDQLTEEMLERLKTKAKVATLSNLDGSLPIAEDIGRQVLSLGRRISPAEVYMRIDAVTLQDVKQVVYDHFCNVNPAIVGIGKVSALPDYSVIQNWTNWGNTRREQTA